MAPVGYSCWMCSSFHKKENSRIRLGAVVFFWTQNSRHSKALRPMQMDRRANCNGVPEVIRTPDLPLRRRSLYPAELRKHITKNIITHFCRLVKCLLKNSKKELTKGNFCGMIITLYYLWGSSWRGNFPAGQVNILIVFAVWLVGGREPLLTRLTYGW